MSPDEIDAKLRDAINGAAELAGACTHKTGVDPGSWRADHRAVFDIPGGRRIADTGGAIFAMYIAENDPVATLRRAAADRRVLKRHQPVPDHGRHSEKDCPVWCDGDHTAPMVCGTCRDLHGDLIEWPCDDLADLAARYGIDLERSGATSRRAWRCGCRTARPSTRAQSDQGGVRS